MKVDFQNNHFSKKQNRKQKKNSIGVALCGGVLGADSYNKMVQLSGLFSKNIQSS